MASSGQTLGSGLLSRDGHEFVGRADELERLEALLEDLAGPRVVFIHGPGGVGKSTLIRELARRAGSRGFELHWIEGRDLPPAPDALDEALIEARLGSRPLVVIDTYERISGLGGLLRSSLLPDLPETSLVVIASRRPPESAWHQAGWENMVIELELDGMPRTDAVEVLARNGLEEGAEAERILRWARGMPLALTLAARTPRERGDEGLREPELIDLLVRRLADRELDQAHMQTLTVASIARTTTPELLAEVLPDKNAAAEFEWLCGLSFAAPLAGGVALHELVGESLHDYLRRSSPELEQTLRVRIADHLYRRAEQAGGREMMLSVDLAHLAKSPAIRWGYSWELAARFRVDDVEPADAGVIHDFLTHGERSAHWPVTEQFLRDAPEHVVAVRDSTDELRGYAIAVSPDGAPEFAKDDPLLGPRIEHARSLGRDQAVIVRDAYDVGKRPSESTIPLLGMASVMRVFQGNPRYAYLRISPGSPGVEFADALGAEHAAELDVTIAGETIECRIVDYGPGGLLAAQRELVHIEAGRAAPPRESEGLDIREAVRQALRSFHVPSELAQNPLARGSSTQERAEYVRGLLRRAVDDCFGDDANENLMRQVLTKGYLDPASGHELAAQEAYLSRSTYFRRLKLATERLAVHIRSEYP